jgi:hypothetical protein
VTAGAGSTATSFVTDVLAGVQFKDGERVTDDENTTMDDEVAA